MVSLGGITGREREGDQEIGEPPKGAEDGLGKHGQENVLKPIKSCSNQGFQLKPKPWGGRK